VKRLAVLVLLLCVIAGALVSCVPDPEAIDLGAFSSVQQLKTWLAADGTDGQAYVDVTHDCDDFARDLQKAGAEDGYLINLEFVIEEDAGHVCNAVIIGNSVWFIEPQTDEVWFMGYLD